MPETPRTCMLSRVNQTALELPPAINAIRAAAPAFTGLTLLALFGSRARGEASPNSDWDFGFLAGEPFDRAALLELISTALATDAVDLVDLSRASALCRFRAGRDGQLLFERAPGTFLSFQEQTALFWCDVEPVLRRAYDGVLEGLNRP